MTLYRVTTIIVAVLLVAGCATLAEGTTQTVAVDTPGAAGATCVLSSPRVTAVSITTPGVAIVKKGRDAIAVQCTKDCYQPSAGVLNSNLTAAVAGNILIGGVIGLAIDAASGASHKYDGTVSVAMTPIAGCRPSRPVA
jgi:hypothetical protein